MGRHEFDGAVEVPVVLPVKKRGLSLTMGPGESRHITNELAGAGKAFNHSGKRSHGLASGQPEPSPC